MDKFLVQVLHKRKDNNEYGEPFKLTGKQVDFDSKLPVSNCIEIYLPFGDYTIIELNDGDETYDHALPYGFIGADPQYFSVPEEELESAKGLVARLNPEPNGEPVTGQSDVDFEVTLTAIEEEPEIPRIGLLESIVESLDDFSEVYTISENNPKMLTTSTPIICS